MVKRTDHNDSTMEVSESQLVPDPPKAPGGRRSIPPNDASVWMQSVVSGDEFAPARAKAKSPGRGLLVFGVLAAAALVGGGIAIWQAGDQPQSPPAVTPPREPIHPAAAPASPMDAAASDAPPAAAPPVDAITGGGPAFNPADTKPAEAKPVKPTPKKRVKKPKKRTTTKKKPAAKRR
ncbi:MAG: hypothetical protein AB7P03_26420 [Kofleriaceae bacterium]